MNETQENANHHLWNNNGTWFVHYTHYPTQFSKERVRRSLKTRDLAEARERRDALLRGLNLARDTTNVVEHTALAA